MKKIYKITQKILLVSFLLIGYIVNAQFTPINVNTTPITSSCNISGDTFGVSVPSEVLSGDNIPLNITLPPTGCDIDISIVYSSPNNKIEYVSSTSLIDFSNSGNTTTNDNPIATGNDGKNFNIFFKFPNYTTCNDELGTFTVTFTTCTSICTATVSTTARAANYWTVTKSFKIGDRVCGISKWELNVNNNNPNPSGFGGYKIQGTITENPLPPASVVSSFFSSGGSIFSVSSNKSSQTFHPLLNNCGNDGDIITNIANYNFTLGDGCETMIDSVSADSPPLQSPNVSLDFTKVVNSNNGSNGISPGCDGYYTISVENDGNVPFQINSIMDVIPVSDIDITSISSNVFVTNDPLTSSTITFTPALNSVILLAPGEVKQISIYFTVKTSAVIGSTVTNTAYISYNAVGTTSSTGDTPVCSTINCPPIDESILPDDDSASFVVIAPKPKGTFGKCVIDKPAGYIYNLGDEVRFRYVLGNGGSANLTTTINDYLGLPNQNVQIDPTSISYMYYENIHLYASCINDFQNPQPITFGVASDTSNLQDPNFAISNMPGSCDLFKQNLLVVEFNAEVLTQMYGNKINTAYTDFRQSSASYTIDQFGVLGVNKRADQEFVEDGVLFNYIIEVTNNGSVPLDHITITDNLPSCVSLTEGITITDFANNNLNYTNNGFNFVPIGSANIEVDPTAQIMPGQKFTITIPVIKNGGGTCCNESVTANGTMITSGVVLDANFGTPAEPAACVKSTKCCDIQDFESSVYENSDGSYRVEINGGAVPLQEVAISVIDYHVAYSQRECQPQDMGTFGELSTNTQLLDGLVLDATTNNTSNLTWLLGNPTVMNSSINFNISKPNVLELECCDVTFYFCIKVTVKDVNCNVCEKIICPEPFEEPCNVSVEEVKEQYCTGDTITLNWTGSDTSNSIDVYLSPIGGGSQIQIGSNLAESDTLNWIIPTSITPCDSRWKIVVVDSKIDDCKASSNTFTIKCCEPKCDCGDWKTNVVTIESSHLTPYEDSKEEIIKKSSANKIYFEQNKIFKVKCQGGIKLNKGTYQITSPMYSCEGDCHATYTWTLRNLDTGQVTSGVGNNFNYNFNQPGKFKLIFVPNCGDNECGACEIMIGITK